MIKLPVFRWLHTPTYVHSRTRILRGVLYYLFKANSSKVHPWYGICRVFKVLGSSYGGGRLFGTHDKQNSAPNGFSAANCFFVVDCVIPISDLYGLHLVGSMPGLD